MQKNCKECCLQGHNKSGCWNGHPELYESKREQIYEKDNKHTEEGHVDQKRDSRNNNGRERNPNKQQCLTRRNRYRRNKYGHILGDIEENKVEDTPISNAFATLSEDEANEEDITTKKIRKSRRK